MSWSSEEIRLLKEKWVTPMTAAEIVKLLKGKTRNAVIGKAHRLGLPDKRTIAVEGAAESSNKSRKPRAKLAEADITELETAFAQGLSVGHIVSMFEAKYQAGTIRARVTKLRAAKQASSVTVTTSPHQNIGAPKLVSRTRSFTIESNVIPMSRPEVVDDKLMIGTKEPVDGYCKWPFGDPGDPDFHYCGKKCDKERYSFCPEHGVHKKSAPNKEPQPLYFLPRRRR